MKFTGYVVCCALVCVVWCGVLSTSVASAAAGSNYIIPRPHARSSEATMTLCGKNLADARMLFCYEKGYIKKKSVFPPIMNSLIGRGGYTVGGYEDDAEDGRDNMEVEGSLASVVWPLLARHRANSFALDGRGKRDGPGLVDECCYKPCTLNELLNYC